MTMHDYRSPAEIEREIEEERRNLTGTLDALQDRFSLNSMTTEAGEYIRTQSGEIVGAVARAVRENPMAIALTGAGIAWMILGNRRSGPFRDDWRSDDGYDFDDEDGYGSSTVGRSAYAYRAGTEDRYAGGYYDEGGGTRSFARTVRDDDPDWVRGYADVLGTSDDTGPSYADDPIGGTSSATDRLKAGVRKAGDRMREGSQDIRHGAESRIEAARRRLKDLRERLSHGTEDMSEDARRRIVAARERAMEARHQMSRQWDSGSRAAAGMYDRQPLAAAALAFAAGAALAAALPRTRMEDEYLGEHSDTLLHEAERLFEEERAKLGAVVRAAADEARDVMSEKAGEAKEGAKAMGDEAREAAERVAERARAEAEKQNLGQPGKHAT